MICRKSRSGKPTAPGSGPVWAGGRKRLLGAAALLPLSWAAAMPAGAQELPSFAILAGSTITNTGPTTITGNIGLSPGLAFTGQGSITQTGDVFLADQVAINRQADLTTLYNVLAARPTSAGGNLTGTDLGGLVLSPGVYNFDTSAGLAAGQTLTLDGGGDPDAVFIFNIGSTLIAESGSSILLQNGAQGGNVFFRVGSSATLRTSADFEGQIVALTSITLETAATIDCGAALARNGAVTLDTNTIGVCVIDAPAFGETLGGEGGEDSQPTGTAQSIADALDAVIANGGSLPSGFAILALTLTPSELTLALEQLSGEVATGVAPAAMQAMDSFLDMTLGGGGVMGPAGGGPLAGEAPPASPPTALPSGPPAPETPGTVSALGYGAEEPAADASMFASQYSPRQARNRSVWMGGYGGRSSLDGDRSAGTHERTTRDFGVAFGIDYRVDPYTTIGFAMAAGGTDFDLGEDFGSGSSDTYHVAVHARTETDAVYLTGAIAYGYSEASTERTVTIAGTDRFAAGFDAHNFAAHLEAGYKMGWITPYAAVRAQAFMTPDYSEHTIAGVSTFALDYEGRTTTAIRSELGVRTQWSTRLDSGALTLRGRAAWAHDYSSDDALEASFQAISGSQLTSRGAAGDQDWLLVSVGAGVALDNGFFVTGALDSRIGENGQTHAASVKLGYTW